MSINDPLSDMIARIKNAATRKRSTVLTPASRLRQRVLDVLADEGYIRGYALVENPGEFPQFQIELKYFDGRGNYAMGLKEHIVFPEINYDQIDQMWGMDIIVCTTARTDEEAKALLSEFKFPFTS